MMMQKHRLILVSVTISNFLSQLYKRRLWRPAAAFAVLIPALVFAGIRDDAEALLNQHFSADTKLSFIKYDLTPEIKTPIEREVKQRFYSSFVYTWVISAGDSIVGYAFLDNVKGKSMPITFIVLYNTNGSVVHSAVVKYREPIGGEVGRQSWLDQFLGKNSSSVYDEIDAISGATISVNSVTRGIHKLTLLMDAVKTDLVINE